MKVEEKKKISSKKLGKLGETIAAKYLEKHDYTILERNWFCRFGEIDIIAKDLKTKQIVFVEVKTRQSISAGFPMDAITKNKLLHIYRSACCYLQDVVKEIVDYRIDGISVMVLETGSLQVSHLKNI